MHLYNLDILTYLILWVCSVSYALYGVFNTRAVFNQYEDVYGDFQPGWLSTSRKDSADLEWRTSLVILNLIWPWILVQLIISELLQITYSKMLPYWQLMLSLSFTIYVCGVTGMFLILFQPLLFGIFHKFQSKFAYWMCEVFCLALLSYFKTTQIDHLLNETQLYMITVGTFWINLRCLSYSLDSEKPLNWLEFVSYCLYLPLLFFGPFVLYKNFKRKDMSSFYIRIIHLITNVIRFGFWLLFTEFALHYFYINVLSFHPMFIRSFNSWTLYGYGYSMGQFFHLKYVVIYGLSTSICKFENIKCPSIPKCIGRIHLYSDMWKHFDEGLYTFLVEYIYKPTLKNRSTWNKVFSSFLCFLFAFIWHGLQSHILIWVCLNFLGITLENLCSWFDMKNYLKLTSWWKNQIICAVASPLLAISAISNFYFFAGVDIGNVFMERIVFGPFVHTFVLLIFLYCCCHVSIKVKKWETTRKKIK